MENFKGTPGPWYIQFMGDDEDLSNDFWIKSDHNKVVNYGTYILCDDYGEHNGYTAEQRYNDGKLIAAAPELLEACIKMIEYYENGKTSNGISCIEKAISKALGK